MKYDTLVKIYEATRRDDLAKAAMQAMISNMGMDSRTTMELKEDFNAIPVLAYKMADKMIAEGKK